MATTHQRRSIGDRSEVTDAAPDVVRALQPGTTRPGHSPGPTPDKENPPGGTQQVADDLPPARIRRQTREKTLVAARNGQVLHTMGTVRAGTAPVGYPAVSVVVPTRNEARNLEIILPTIAALRPAVHEIIVVDGNSTDGSLEVAHRVLPSVRTITQTRRGKGNAMACGFAAVTGDVVVMFDADGSADPAEIPRFVAALMAGADFAKGSRFTAGGGSDDITLVRRTGNAGLNAVANALFGTSFTDLCYGYNAFWADVAPVFDLPPVDVPASADAMLWGDGFEIETVLNCRVAAAHLTITEVPSVERRRMFGDTNLRTFPDGIRVLRTLLAERRRTSRNRRHGRSAHCRHDGDQNHHDAGLDRAAAARCPMGFMTDDPSTP